jgi:excisionase family DNA binding protein
VSLAIPDARPLSVPQLAERWGCSEGLIYKLIRKGDLHCFRPGALIRISAAEVERYECQASNENTPSSGSVAASQSPSPILTPGSAAAASSPRKIGRAPRRKRANSGPQGTTIHRGPWAGS